MVILLCDYRNGRSSERQHVHIAQIPRTGFTFIVMPFFLLCKKEKRRTINRYVDKPEWVLYDTKIFQP